MSQTRSAPQSAGVTIEGLSLAYGATDVLKGIDLAIRDGELFTFLGPSGSGKSTLLRAIAGFGPRPSGRILIGDEEVTGLPPWKRNVGMVFQSYALWPHMTVRRNVAFGLEERRLPREEIRRGVEAALELVGLLDLAERRPSQLSGGQQQRVALARTVVVEPRVLLLDEPLSNLDANLRIQMRREILDLQRKLSLTTIFVTHDQEEANTISDRIAVLDAGVLQQVGAPMELYDRPANLFVAGFLGTANVLEGRVAEQGGRPVFRTAEGIELPLPEAAAGPCSIVFRPQNLVIVAEGADPATNAGAVKLSGVVRHREFLGSIIRYAVDLSGSVILVDDSHQRGQATLDPGQRADLFLDHREVVALAG